MHGSEFHQSDVSTDYACFANEFGDKNASSSFRVVLCWNRFSCCHTKPKKSEFILKSRRTKILTFPIALL